MLLVAMASDRDEWMTACKQGAGQAMSDSAMVAQEKGSRRRLNIKAGGKGLMAMTERKKESRLIKTVVSGH